MATIQGIYIALFGRPADPLGLAFFNEATQNGADLTAIGDLSASAEYQSRFEGMTNVQIVNSIYQSLFGRDADLAGLTFFVGQLQSGAQSINTIAINIYDGAQGDDLTVLQNKEAAANLFTASLDTGTEVAAYQGDDAAAAGRAFLTPITADEATIPTQAQVDAAIQAIVDGVGTPGGEFILTDAVGEVVNGTANDDTFSAVVDGATSANGTFNVGDTINGGAGQDTFNLLVAAGGALPAGATTNSVEIVNITYADGQNLGALSSASFGGVQQLWQIDNTAANSDFQNVTVGAGVTAGFRSTGASASAVAAAAVVTAAAGVTDVAVALDGVLSGSAIGVAETSANGVTSVTVSGSVTSTAATPPVNTLALNNAAGDVDTLNLAISSNTTVTNVASFDDLVTLDASGSTGGLTIVVGTPDELEVANFGSGNDTIEITSTAALTGDSLAVDLGAGSDTLTIGLDDNTAETTVSITLGEGNDTVIVSSLANITDETDFAVDLATITDFNPAQDVLNLNAIAVGGRDVLINTELALIAEAATLEAALDVAASFTAAGSYSIFEYGDNAYVLNSSAATLADGDGVLEIVGLQISELNAQNFVA
jgi:hypothetical protein